MNKFLVYFFICLLLFLCSCENNEKSRINISIWLDALDKEMEFVKKSAGLFEKEYPNVKINFKFIQFSNLKPSFIGQSKDSYEPDIIFFTNDWIGELAEKRLILPLNESVNYNDFLPITIEGLKYKNKLYALPQSFEVIALVYNKKLIPKPPVDIKQMIQISQKLQKENIYGLMYDNKNFYYHFPWFYGYGGRIFDSKEKFIIPNEQAINSFQFAFSLENEYRIIPSKSNYSAMMNMFCSNQVGMIITGPWSLGEIEKNKISYGVASLPLLENRRHPAPFLGIKCCAISKLSRYPDTAQKIIEFFTSSKIQKMSMTQLGIMPSLKSIYSQGKIPENLQGFYEQAKYAVPMPTTPKMKYVWQEYNWALGRIFDNQEQIKQILSKAAEKIKTNIER